MHNSKLLWCFSGVQTLLILFLVFQTKSLNNQVQDLSAKTSAAMQEPVLLAPVSEDTLVTNPQIHQSFNIPTILEIRKVVADELRNIETNVAVKANRNEADPRHTDSQLSQHTKDQMSDDVYEMISDLYGQRVVAASEIALVEQAIVKLPPAERIKALKELFKSVNSGKINTRF